MEVQTVCKGETRFLFGREGWGAGGAGWFGRAAVQPSDLRRDAGVWFGFTSAMETWTVSLPGLRVSPSLGLQRGRGL